MRRAGKGAAFALHFWLARKSDFCDLTPDFLE